VAKLGSWGAYFGDMGGLIGGDGCLRLGIWGWGDGRLSWGRWVAKLGEMGG
jgi:hypothetical protein